MSRISAAQRRQDFVHAAIEVIATHGIDGATTRRIAEQAQANVALLHYCYDSKEDLFADVYESFATQFRGLIHESTPQSTVIEVARQILRGVMEYYLQSPNFAAAMLELVAWGRRQHQDRGIAVHDSALKAIRGVLRAATSDRPLELDLIDEIAYVGVTMVDGFAVNWSAYGDHASAVRRMELVDSVFESWLSSRLTAPLLMRTEPHEMREPRPRTEGLSTCSAPSSE